MNLFIYACGLSFTHAPIHPLIPPFTYPSIIHRLNPLTVHHASIYSLFIHLCRHPSIYSLCTHSFLELFSTYSAIIQLFNRSIAISPWLHSSISSITQVVCSSINSSTIHLSILESLIYMTRIYRAAFPFPHAARINAQYSEHCHITGTKTHRNSRNTPPHHTHRL